MLRFSFFQATTAARQDEKEKEMRIATLNKILHSFKRLWHVTNEEEKHWDFETEQSFSATDLSPG